MPNHVGITHVGVNGGFLPLTSTFFCNGKVIPYVPKYPVTGTKVLYRIFVMGASGTMYSPGLKLLLVMQGTNLGIAKSRYGLTGLLIKRFQRAFSSVGYLNLIHKTCGYFVNAIKRKRRVYTYSIDSQIILPGKATFIAKGSSMMLGQKAMEIKAVLLQNGRRAYAVIGDRPGVVRSVYSVLALTRAKHRISLMVKGREGQGIDAGILAKGKILRKVSLFYNAVAGLNSQNASAMFGLCGVIPAISFIAAVPKRFQSFVSTKRWFR